MSKKYEKRIETLKKGKEEEDKATQGSSGSHKRTVKSEKKALKEFKKKLGKSKKIW